MKILDDAPQGELPLVDVFAHRRFGAELIESCRDIAATRGWDLAAKELDKTFEPEGRSVSTGVLRNALRVDERNYARMEWVPYFAALSDEPAQVIAMAAGKTLAAGMKLTADQKVELYEERLMREFGAAGARMVASIGGKRR